MIHTYRRLGDLLVSRSAISSLQLSIALADQRISNRRLGEIVVERGYTTEFEVAACLAYQYGYPVVDPATLAPHASAIARLSAEDALSLRALPIEETEQGLLCAISDPIDVFSTDRLAALTHSRLVLHVAPEAALIRAIRAAYGLNASEAQPQYAEAEKVPARFKALVSKQKIDEVALFEAFDTTLDRLVSLVCVPESGPTEMAHFSMVRNAARAPVEGVVSVFDSLTHEGYRWNVLQRITAESLEQILRLRGPRTVPHAATLVARVAEIVDSLQRNGASGAWASPMNVLMSRNGPMLAPLTLPPDHYAAPAKEFDDEMPGPAAAFALGCLLKDCLFGIDSRSPLGVPAPMNDILANCLAIDVKQRYGSAVEVASALRSFNWHALSNPHAHNTNFERDELLNKLGEVAPHGDPHHKASIWERLFGRKAA